MCLLHGTTRARAESIVQYGPNLRFVEPGSTGIAESFSFTVEGAASDLGASVAYAVGKANGFPTEGGAAVLVVDVPDDVVRAAALEHLSLFDGIVEYDASAELGALVALCGGVIQFDPGPVFNRLTGMCNALAKEIRGVP